MKLEEYCPECGHREVSDGYGGNDCPECFVLRDEVVTMEVQEAGTATYRVTMVPATAAPLMLRAASRFKAIRIARRAYPGSRVTSCLVVTD